jgi:hypothetical protein
VFEVWEDLLVMGMPHCGDCLYSHSDQPCNVSKIHLILQACYAATKYKYCHGKSRGIPSNFMQRDEKFLDALPQNKTNADRWEKKKKCKTCQYFSDSVYFLCQGYEKKA